VVNSNNRIISLSTIVAVLLVIIMVVGPSNSDSINMQFTFTHLAYGQFSENTIITANASNKSSTQLPVILVHA
jgi:hypothetical protein